MTILHVGCGNQPLPPDFKDYEETRLDIDKDVKPDIQASITDMSAVKSNSFDALFTSHTIEHLFYHDVPKAFGEFLRVLKPRGKAFIQCPNIKEVAKYIATDKLEDVLYYTDNNIQIKAIDVVFGWNVAIKGSNEFMVHKTAFTARTLKEKLLAAGFDSVETNEDVYELYAHATKGGLE